MSPSAKTRDEEAAKYRAMREKARIKQARAREKRKAKGEVLVQTQAWLPAKRVEELRRGGMVPALVWTPAGTKLPPICLAAGGAVPMPDGEPAYPFRVPAWDEE